jgi:hypothetical protein
MEKRDAAGYARIPSEASEFEEWESEQIWAEDQEVQTDGTNADKLRSGCIVALTKAQDSIGLQKRSRFFATMVGYE